MFQDRTGPADPAQGSLFPPSVTASPPVLEFPSTALGERLVAGVPAVARLVRAIGDEGHRECIVLVPDASPPGAYTRAELTRLAPQVRVAFASRAEGAEGPPERGIHVGLAGMTGTYGAPALTDLDETSARKALDAWGRTLLKATGKPGDGIVSRWLNRPISQAISGQLLRFPGVTPLHATCITAVVALAMLAVLVSGGPVGLVIGAVLFQAASIVDGVDGEIARATFRESPAGARLDSLIDAATNLAFVGGAAINLLLQGDRISAYAGGIGLIAFAAGLAIIGRHSRRQASGLTFNAVKDHFRERPSPLMQFLTWLTMRDFFALAFAVLIAAGFAGFALKAFLVIVCGWLAVVLGVMLRRT